jgi:hypothetical protein
MRVALVRCFANPLKERWYVDTIWSCNRHWARGSREANALARAACGFDRSC